jgi:uncharacterized protein YgbK (DUF1537 family)
VRQRGVVADACHSFCRGGHRCTFHAHDVAAIARELRANGRAALGIGDGPATRGLEAAELVRRLAVSAQAVLAATPVRRVLLEGGATAAAVVRAMGWTRLAPSRHAAPGVGVLAPVAGAAVELCIKPGSYDWPAGFWPPVG